MALIKCPECGKEISEYAYTCPHCGTANPFSRPLKDIKVEGEFEPRYFTYARKKKEADAATEKAEKAAEEKHKKVVRISILAVVLCVVAIIVAIVAYNTSQRNAAERAYEEQVQTDKDVFAVIENAMLGEVEDGKLLVTEQMQDYIENGVTLFGDIKGQFEIRMKLLDENSLWSITFCSEEVTKDRMQAAEDELIYIYGSDYDSSAPTQYAIDYEWAIHLDDGRYCKVYLERNFNDMKIFVGWSYNL